MANKHLGSSLNDFLYEENISPEIEVRAIKRVIAYQIKEAMEKKHLSKIKMASLMHTSRASLDRLLDPYNNGVTLDTLEKAVGAMGGKLNLSISFPDSATNISGIIN
jgi:transcriptional regulator with XRE-family HTH domain